MNMENRTETVWLYLEPYTFISEEQGRWLFYNAFDKEGFIVLKDEALIPIVKHLQDVDHLYSVRISLSDLDNPVLFNFVCDLQNHRMGNLLLDLGYSLICIISWSIWMEHVICLVQIVRQRSNNTFVVQNPSRNYDGTIWRVLYSKYRIRPQRFFLQVETVSVIPTCLNCWNTYGITVYPVLFWPIGGIWQRISSNL